MKKKKPTKKAGLNFSRLTKGLLIMNLSMLCMLVFSVQILASSSSYAEVKKLNLQVENATVEEVITVIQKQSEFEFFYNHELLNQSKKRVNLDIKNETIHQVLDQLFDSQKVNYTIDDRHIIIVPLKTGKTEAEDDAEDSVSEELQAQQQEIEVSGTVTDAQTGDPLPGVNIVVQGTTIGTTTDMDGEYSFEVPADAILVFSFVGYQEQTVEIDGREEIDVTMEQAITELEEVVAIGYGTQKKVNLTGSVSSTNMEQLEKKAVTQASQSLAGEVSGITVTQGSGEPGANQASLRIRGLGTFSGAGNSPLVIVDGRPSSLDAVNPNNIASISVLKDAASSAIYGSRAANGVILVTTKEGKAGELQVTYESYIGKQEAVELPSYVDSWTYAEMENEARVNQGQGIKWSQEEIDKFRSGTDPDNFPNKHHLKDLFNSGSGLQTKHNLTFSGGTESNRYLFSAGYLRQNGLIEQNHYDRYDMRLNMNSKLEENLNLNVKLFGNQALRKEPAGIETNGTSVSDMVNAIVGAANHYNATFPGRKSDGTYGIAMGHPVARAHLDGESFGENEGTDISANVALDWSILESLKLTGRMAYDYSNNKNKLFGAEHTFAPGWTFGPSQIDVRTSKSTNLLLESLIDYDKTFGNHHLHVLGGFSNEKYDGEWMGGYRDNVPTNKLHVLSAASSENDSNYESGATWKLLSYFGRVNYSFQDKYLLEGNLRYDGSSRFAEDNRYGLFPSFSAAWIISEENFFQVPWIEVLKLRGSYGILGNQEIGTYPYHKILDLGDIYVVGDSESIQPAIELSRLPFQDITWESTKITNIGFDLNLFEGKLNIIADYYYKKTVDILYYLSVSDVLGMGVSEQNAGEVENKGLEFELTHKNTLGDFSYSISPNFSINQNKVLALAGVERDVGQGLFLGEPLQSIYGYETDGLFVDQADIDNWPEQNYETKPGFPRYVDINGPDGKPDGQISASYDRRVLGSRFPKYSYGMGVMANYKGFDLYMQVQGQGGFKRLISGDQLAYNNFGDIQQWHVNNRWTEENPDRNAIYPRMEWSHVNQPPWTPELEYWMRDASFLRIKNIQLGYNVPSRFISNTFIDQFRIYVSGQNIYTFDNYFPGWDPEMNTGGYGTSRVGYYPLTRLWSLGINVQF